MITVQRLNLDSSWYFKYEGLCFLLDPWLLGSEIDGFRWFSEQWHIQEPLALSDIPDYQFIVISQPYEDHCHIPTLRSLPTHVPILAVPKAAKRLRRIFKDRTIVEIPVFSGFLEYNGIKIMALRPRKVLDPVFGALLICGTQKEAIFYAPHGYSPRQEELDLLEQFDVQLLMTTFTEFRLPAIMGGLVNPGVEGAATLCKKLKPRHVINTHDEPKKMAGLVAKLAKTKYPDLGLLASNNELKFVYLKDYQPVNF